MAALPREGALVAGASSLVGIDALKVLTILALAGLLGAVTRLAAVPNLAAAMAADLARGTGMSGITGRTAVGAQMTAAGVDGAVGHHRAAEDGKGKIGVAGDGGAGEVGIDQTGIAQVGAGEVRAAGIDAGKIRAAEVAAGAVEIGEGGGALQVAVAEVGAGAGGAGAVAPAGLLDLDLDALRLLPISVALLVTFALAVMPALALAAAFALPVGEGIRGCAQRCRTDERRQRCAPRLPRREDTNQSIESIAVHGDALRCALVAAATRCDTDDRTSRLVGSAEAIVRCREQRRIGRATYSGDKTGTWRSVPGRFRIQTSPSRTPRTAASARERAPSLPRMAATWWVTVR